MSTGIGERIKQRRIELELSQGELAKLMGYKSRQAISKIEMGDDNLSTVRVEAFAVALRTTTNYLMGYDVRKDSLTKENAIFSVDMLSNPLFLDYAKKLFHMEEPLKERVYDYIDFLLSK